MSLSLVMDDHVKKCQRNKRTIYSIPNLRRSRWRRTRSWMRVWFTSRPLQECIVCVLIGTDCCHWSSIAPGNRRGAILLLWMGGWARVWRSVWPRFWPGRFAARLLVDVRGCAGYAVRIIGLLWLGFICSFMSFPLSGSYIYLPSVASSDDNNCSSPQN